MNKKLLFAAVSLAALTACSTDDFQSQNIAAEKTSPVQFEVINNNDAFTRAYMEGSQIHWEASKGDLFTLYHGGTAPTSSSPTLTSYQNATYTAAKGDGAATLTTPSMILPGSALMIWPVDTAFTNDGSEALAISIPETLDNIENNITYASDLVNIKAYKDNNPNPAYAVGDPNTAGYNRKYPVYMRPLTSQLTLKADYAGTESVLDALSTGTDAIDPIAVTSVDLTSEGTNFTQKIALNFKTAETDDVTRWGGADRDNTWSHITSFAATVPNENKVNKLTTKVLTGNESAKFLILPKSTTGDKPAIVVNTTYGKVVLGEGTSYNNDEKAKAWYKLSGTTKTEESDVKTGLSAVFTAINNTKVTANTVVKDEPVGASATRYVTVLLTKLDMDGLHVKTDKQLYDAVRVWKELGLDNTAHKITVNLDGDANKEFKISQKTIAKINELNAAAALEDQARSFVVQPCTGITGEECETIVITGGGDIQDIPFVVANTDNNNNLVKAAVVLNEGKTWKWNGISEDVKTVTVGTGVSRIINNGTMENSADATLAVYLYTPATTTSPATPATTVQTTDVDLENNGTWNITSGRLYVQFDVTNYGTVKIANGAQYRQQSMPAATQGGNATATTFTNEALTLPKQFITDSKVKEQIGKIENNGVLAVADGSTNNGSKINNYGLIEHAAGAKTFITANQQLPTNAATGYNPFSAAFDNGVTAVANANKMGRINLKYDNKDEQFISISSELGQGFVSVTVDGEVTNGKLNTSAVGSKVNYVIVKSGITSIEALPAQIKYVQIEEKGTDVLWNTDAGYEGLIILSDVYIAQGKKVAAKVTYLGADMYVGGNFNKDANVTIGSNTVYQPTTWAGYYGDTSANVATKYATW